MVNGFFFFMRYCAEIPWKRNIDIATLFRNAACRNACNLYLFYLPFYFVSVNHAHSEILNENKWNGNKFKGRIWILRTNDRFGDIYTYLCTKFFFQLSTIFRSWNLWLRLHMFFIHAQIFSETRTCKSGTKRITLANLKSVGLQDFSKRKVTYILIGNNWQFERKFQ